MHPSQSLHALPHALCPALCSACLLPCPAARTSLCPTARVPPCPAARASPCLTTGASPCRAARALLCPAARASSCLAARTSPCPAAHAYTWRPGSGLYTLTTEAAQVGESGQVALSVEVAATCSCRLLMHQTLLWYHRLGHPSLPRLRGMHSHLLVSRLPRSLHPLPRSFAPPCLPCVEGRQRAAPHSSFPQATAPLQTLHMDVFPLQSKADVRGVLICWIRAVRRQLSARFWQDLPVLRLHSDQRGEFCSRLLEDLCGAEGIRQSFTLPASPQYNGIAECRIGLVMEVALTSIVHATAPHFLWPFAIRYAAEQLNLWPRVSHLETSPTLRWMGEVGDMSVFQVWGFLALVRDLPAPRTLRCVFLGFPTDAPLWQFYHPGSHRVLSSQDVTFDESVGFYRLHPQRSPAPSGVSQVDPPPLVEPLEVSSDTSGPAEGGDPAAADTVAPRRSACLATPLGFPPRPSSPPLQPVAVDSGAAGGGDTGGADSRGAGSWVAECPMGIRGVGGVGGACASGTGVGGAGGFGAGDASAGETGARWKENLSPERLCEWAVRWGSPGGGASRARFGGARATGAGGTGVGGTRVGGVGCPSAGDASAGDAGARRQETLSPKRLREWAVQWGIPGGGASRARAVGAIARGARAGGDGGIGAVGAGGTGAAGAGGAGVPDGKRTVPCRPFFYPQPQSSLPLPDSALPQVLSLPSSTGLTPPLLCPPLDQSQPELLPGSPLPAPSPYPAKTGSLAEHCEPESGPASPVRTISHARHSHPPSFHGTHTMILRPSFVPQQVALPSPLASSLPDVPDPESTAVFSLVTELVNFAATRRLDYVASLVTKSESVCPPSVGGELAFGCDVLEDRKFELECLAVVLPRFASMLFCHEGDPDALDIPTPRSYAEVIMKSTGTYVDEIPPPWENIVDGMWIFIVKRPPGSPPAFKAHYVARGFSQRQGVDFFQTFSPTPKITTLRVLLHIAAQGDYERHSLDFSTAFLQGTLHEKIWLHRSPGFTRSFPAGTLWSLWRPVYGLRQAPCEWHDTLRTAFAALGFAPSTADPSLFLRTDPTLPPFYILVPVSLEGYGRTDPLLKQALLSQWSSGWDSDMDTC
ncbi:unnamed protein product [Closterium sp. NIES-54]